MINFFNKKREKKTSDSVTLFTSTQLTEEIETKFPDYSYIASDLKMDDYFCFIYKNCQSISQTLILLSALELLEEPSMEEIEEAYDISFEETEHIISDTLPKLRVLAYKAMEAASNTINPWFPDLPNNQVLIFQHLIEKIEYLFEIRRNQKKLLQETNNSIYKAEKNNKALLFLANYLSATDTLMIASALGLLDEDTSLPINEEDMKNLFNSSTITLIIKDLNDRIIKLSTSPEALNDLGCIDQYEQYQDLLNRIQDTMKYFQDKPPKR